MLPPSHLKSQECLYFLEVFFLCFFFFLRPHLSVTLLFLSWNAPLSKNKLFEQYFILHVDYNFHCELGKRSKKPPKKPQKWTGLASNMNFTSKSSCFVLFFFYILCRKIVRMLCRISRRLFTHTSSLKCLTSLSSAVLWKYLIPLWIHYCFKEMKYWFHSLLGHYLHFMEMENTSTQRTEVAQTHRVGNWN